MATVPSAGDAHESGGPPLLEARLEKTEDGDELYTVAPSDATGIDLMSQWLSVSVETVCDLREMR